MKAVYSVAYIEVRRNDKGGIVHGWVWAAWWSGEPCGSPWRTPDAFGVVEQAWGTPTWARGEGMAEIAADEACREGLRRAAETYHFYAQASHAVGWDRSVTVETRRICGSFALAARRENEGRPPRYRSPRSPSSPCQKPVGHDRPPTVTARTFFEAFWRDVEKRVKEWRNHAASWGGEPLWWQGRSPQLPKALTELGLDAKATAADVRRAFRRRALVDHPDRGGTSERFRRLVELRDQALREVSPTGP